MRKQLLIAATALAISAAPAALAAQGGATKPAPAKTGAAAPKAGAPAAKATLSPEDQANITRAAVILRAFNVAFQSKEVQQPVKGQLLSCLYNNKLSTISSATQRVFDQNPSLKKDDATTIYRVAAGVCGIAFKRADGQPDPSAAAAPGAPGAPKAPAESR